MGTPHFPGQETKRQFSGYTKYQQALWETFEDVYWAQVNGYAEMRKPHPEVEIDQERYERWEATLYERYKVEATRDVGTSALQPGEWDQSSLQHLFQNMVAADPLNVKTPPPPPACGIHIYDDCG